jgi:hypothetical protein
MTKQELIKRIEQVENGKTDTRKNVINALWDMDEDCSLVYDDWGIHDGISIELQPSSGWVHPKEWEQIGIDWEVTEKGMDNLYTYKIS